MGFSRGLVDPGESRASFDRIPPHDIFPHDRYGGIQQISLGSQVYKIVGSFPC